MMDVHLVDGTYELFRYHFAPNNRDLETGAVRGVLGSVLALLESGATHVAVATDHVIESFRNDLWPGYKTSAGMPRELLAQFGLLEDVPPAGEEWSVGVRNPGRLAAVLQSQFELALLFRRIATVESGADVVASIDEIEWRGPARELLALAEQINGLGLAERAIRLAER